MTMWLLLAFKVMTIKQLVYMLQKSTIAKEESRLKKLLKEEDRLYQTAAYEIFTDIFKMEIIMKSTFLFMTSRRSQLPQMTVNCYRKLERSNTKREVALSIT